MCPWNIVVTGCAPVQNADDAGSDSAAEAGFSGGNSLAAVSFSGLYEALGKRLGNERTVLLLYDALHTCVYFQSYVLVRGWAAFPCCSHICVPTPCFPTGYRALTAMPCYRYWTRPNPCW